MRDTTTLTRAPLRARRERLPRPVAAYVAAAICIVVASLRTRLMHGAAPSASRRGLRRQEDYL